MFSREMDGRNLNILCMGLMHTKVLGLAVLHWPIGCLVSIIFSLCPMKMEFFAKVLTQREIKPAEILVPVCEFPKEYLFFQKTRGCASGFLLFG